MRQSQNDAYRLFLELAIHRVEVLYDLMVDPFVFDQGWLYLFDILNGVDWEDLIQKLIVAWFVCLEGFFMDLLQIRQLTEFVFHHSAH